MKKQIKYFLIGTIVFLLYFKILPFILKFIITSFMNTKNKLLVNIINSVAEIIIFLFLFLIFKKTIIDNFKKFKKDYKKDLDIGFKYYFVGLLVMITSNLILTGIFGTIAANEAANRTFLKAYPLYSIVAMVILGPTIEEIVFRLGFRKAFNKWVPYALFSAILFGAVHVYSAYEGMNLVEIVKNWHHILYIIPYGSLGFAFAKAYYDTDNIWTSMTIHTLHNAFTILLIICVGG